ncbi:hypothetical protein [Hephaestia mangrovi]|uniref:hypothetical protein n=1 Tax=Hephaestia mangrovi TaxID=2873268 RepID=UPI001CA632E3|nr:hypothetical protein [Hephaestia mangrovi]MBY8829324.1 hypothetical protein [Hephaestia mangrovi]
MAAGRTRRPFWAAGPTRFAALSRGQARIVLALVALVVLACFTAIGAPSGDGPAIGAGAAAIVAAIIDGIRHGGTFYTVAHATIGGQSGAATPMPMPILPLIEAALPGWIDLLMLAALIAGAVAAWFVRFRPTLQRGAALVPPMLVAVGATRALSDGLVALPAAWAGALVALSLAAWRPGRWVEAAAFATIAMLIEPAAALYAAIMLLVALADGDGREALGWGGALAAFALAFACHLHAANGGDLPPVGLLGLGAMVRASVAATALAALPMLVAAPLAGLALAGWAAWPDPAGPRVAIVLVAYAAFLAVVPNGETIARVMLVTPILFAGLALAPDAIGDLVHRALDRRRITVTRLTR